MPAVTKFFFRSSLDHQSTWSTVHWWETRRPAFNVAVGTAGLLTLATVAAVSALPPHSESFVVPWGVPLAYGLLANVCYSLGAPIELALRRWIGDGAAAAGAALFRYGFVFAVGLTLFPAGVAVLAKLALVVMSLLR